MSRPLPTGRAMERWHSCSSLFSFSSMSLTKARWTTLSLTGRELWRRRLASWTCSSWPQMHTAPVVWSSHRCRAGRCYLLSLQTAAEPAEHTEATPSGSTDAASGLNSEWRSFSGGSFSYQPGRLYSSLDPVSDGRAFFGATTGEGQFKMAIAFPAQPLVVVAHESHEASDKKVTPQVSAGAPRRHCRCCTTSPATSWPCP